MTSIPFKQTEPVPVSWQILFYTLHAADVWSTVEGLKYDCIVEANPLLPDIPHRDRLLIHKLIFLEPFNMLLTENALTKQDMYFPIAVAAYVVHSNIELTREAKQKCNLR